jgi:hypothetical protein
MERMQTTQNLTVRDALPPCHVGLSEPWGSDNSHGKAPLARAGLLPACALDDSTCMPDNWMIQEGLAGVQLQAYTHLCLRSQSTLVRGGKRRRGPDHFSCGSGGWEGAAGAIVGCEDTAQGGGRDARSIWKALHSWVWGQAAASMPPTCDQGGTLEGGVWQRRREQNTALHRARDKEGSRQRTWGAGTMDGRAPRALELTQCRSVPTPPCLRGPAPPSPP